MRLTQAILPVAGFGTRFLPWTKVVPKELLPIGNVPIIALLVDECLSVGIRDICFVISRGKEAIPEYFESHRALERELESRGKLHMLEELKKYDNVNFHVVYQNEMKGDGHAILQAHYWVGSDPVAVLFGDDLIVGKKNGLQQLVSAYEGVKSKRDAAFLCLQKVPEKLVSKYGIVAVDAAQSKGRIKRITGLVEKPQPKNAPSNLGIVGKYVIPRSTIEVLHRTEAGHSDKEIRLIDALKSQLKTVDVYGYEFEGQRLDTGTPEGYREAVSVLC